MKIEYILDALPLRHDSAANLQSLDRPTMLDLDPLKINPVKRGKCSSQHLDMSSRRS